MFYQENPLPPILVCGNWFNLRESLIKPQLNRACLRLAYLYQICVYLGNYKGQGPVGNEEIGQYKLGLSWAKLSKAGTELSYLVGCWNY